MLDCLNLYRDDIPLRESKIERNGAISAGMALTICVARRVLSHTASF